MRILPKLKIRSTELERYYNFNLKEIKTHLTNTMGHEDHELHALKTKAYQNPYIRNVP